ncbi:hypothetical protein [Streptomyces griseorubiginosus]|uniref:hypothetical protein n=1 Tax=Streptomyces griseorubiginosus TaxID=67304 RepID=UPI0036651D10
MNRLDPAAVADPAINAFSARRGLLFTVAHGISPSPTGSSAAADAEDALRETAGSGAPSWDGDLTDWPSSWDSCGGVSPV